MRCSNCGRKGADVIAVSRPRARGVPKNRIKNRTRPQPSLLGGAMRMKTLLIAASMTLMALLASCAARLSEQAAKMADADEASVARCEFLGQVQGHVAASTGMESARNQARE